MENANAEIGSNKQSRWSKKEIKLDLNWIVLLVSLLFVLKFART